MAVSPRVSAGVWRFKGPPARNVLQIFIHRAPVQFEPKDVVENDGEEEEVHGHLEAQKIFFVST